MLKVSPWKGVIHFGKRGKMNPRYIRPFKILAEVGTVAYLLELPKQLSRVHSTFHVSNLKKCLVDEPLAIPLDEIQIDDKLNFIEEPVEIMDREVKQLKQSRIPIVKVRWNSKRDSSSSGFTFKIILIRTFTPESTDVYIYTPPRFVHRSLARTPRRSEAFRCWRSPTCSQVPFDTTHVLRSLTTTLLIFLPLKEVFSDRSAVAHTEDDVGMGVEIAASDVREDDEEFKAEGSATGE
ncbi:hypothetical protein Tco_1102223 [Tanacetum coccineum]